MVFNLFNTELSLYFFACWSQAGEWVGQPMWFPIYKACFRGGNLFHQHHTRTPRTPRNWSTVCFTQHLDIHVAYVCNSQSLMLAGEIQSLLVSMGDGHTEANIINELKQWPCWLFTFNFSSLLSCGYSHLGLSRIFWNLKLAKAGWVGRGRMSGKVEARICQQKGKKKDLSSSLHSWSPNSHRDGVPATKFWIWCMYHCSPLKKQMHANGPVQNPSMLLQRDLSTKEEGILVFCWLSLLLLFRPSRSPLSSPRLAFFFW